MPSKSEREALRVHHRRRRYPHEGGCPRCRETLLCNVCGRDLEAGPLARIPKRCTNGRCIECHDAVCTPGGTDAPGHAFGSRERAEAQARKRGA